MVRSLQEDRARLEAELEEMRDRVGNNNNDGGYDGERNCENDEGDSCDNTTASGTGTKDKTDESVFPIGSLPGSSCTSEIDSDEGTGEGESEPPKQKRRIVSGVFNVVGRMGMTAVERLWPEDEEMEEEESGGGSGRC